MSGYTLGRRQQAAFCTREVGVRGVLARPKTEEDAQRILGPIEKEMTPEQIAEATTLAREILERIQAKKK